MNEPYWFRCVDTVLAFLRWLSMGEHLTHVMVGLWVVALSLVSYEYFGFAFWKCLLVGGVCGLFLGGTTAFLLLIGVYPMTPLIRRIEKRLNCYACRRGFNRRTWN
jgi:hypothetical protein